MTYNTGSPPNPFARAIGRTEGIGIPWYRREDYPAILDIMQDRKLLPATFDEWEKRAEEVISNHLPPGVTGHRAYIDPKKFRAWCLMRGLNIDAAARGQYAANPINWDGDQKH